MRTIQLSDEQIKIKLKKAEADIKNNKVHSIEDVKKAFTMPRNIK